MGSTGEIQIIPTEVSDEELPLFIMQLASGSVLPMVLKASIELDLFEIIAKAGPGAYVSPSYIASQLTTSNPNAPVPLARMLRLLASHSILTHSQKNLPGGMVQPLYGLGPVCKYLIKNEDGASIAPLCLLNQNKVLMESW